MLTFNWHILIDWHFDRLALRILTSLLFKRLAFWLEWLIHRFFFGLCDFSVVFSIVFALPPLSAWKLFDRRRVFPTSTGVSGLSSVAEFSLQLRRASLGPFRLHILNAIHWALQAD